MSFTLVHLSWHVSDLPNNWHELLDETMSENDIPSQFTVVIKRNRHGDTTVCVTHQDCDFGPMFGSEDAIPTSWGMWYFRRVARRLVKRHKKRHRMVRRSEYVIDA